MKIILSKQQWHFIGKITGWLNKESMADNANKDFLLEERCAIIVKKMMQFDLQYLKNKFWDIYIKNPKTALDDNGFKEWIIANINEIIAMLLIDKEFDIDEMWQKYN